MQFERVDAILDGHTSSNNGLSAQQLKVSIRSDLSSVQRGGYTAASSQFRTSSLTASTPAHLRRQLPRFFDDQDGNGLATAE